MAKIIMEEFSNTFWIGESDGVRSLHDAVIVITIAHYVTKFCCIWLWYILKTKMEEFLGCSSYKDVCYPQSSGEQIGDFNSKAFFVTLLKMYLGRICKVPWVWIRQPFFFWWKDGMFCLRHSWLVYFIYKIFF